MAVCSERRAHPALHLHWTERHWGFHSQRPQPIDGQYVSSSSIGPFENMRDEAKYVCCLGGFIGFISFFTISLLLGEDILAAVVRGSVGCLFCSLCARGILHLVLRSLAMAKNGEGQRVVQSSDETPPSQSQEKPPTATAEIARESVPSPPTAGVTEEATPPSIEPVAA